MKITSLLLLMSVPTLATAEVTYREIAIPEAPFPMPVLKECVFPKRDFPITDFGARPGVKCTDAFVRAMAACEAAGGGRVVVPRGTWLTGAVHFRSNCDLHLAAGAVLEFTDDPADYPKVHTTWEGVECLNISPLLYAYEVENVGLTGEGLIRPRMAFWRTWFARPPAHMYATECLYHWCATNAPMASRDLLAIKGSNVRPHLIQFNRCRNVLIEGIHIKESPFWMIHLYHSENCIVRKVSARAHGHNNDGVDVDMTQNVLIEDCSFDQGDDGVVIKAGRNADAWRLNRPAMNIVVRDCDLHESHSLLGVGSELSGGVRNVWMTRCRATTTICAFKIKTSPRRGGFVENIYMDHCSAKEVYRVADIETQYYCQWKAFPDYELRYTRIRNINIDGLDVRKAETAFRLGGDWHCRPSGIHFSNISVGAVLEKFTDIRNCEDVTLENVRLRPDDGTQQFTRIGALPVNGKEGELSEGHRRAAAFFLRPEYTAGTLADGTYDLGAGAVATVATVKLRPYDEGAMRTDDECDRFYGLLGEKDVCFLKAGEYQLPLGIAHTDWTYVPSGYPFCDSLTTSVPMTVRQVTIRVPPPFPQFSKPRAITAGPHDHLLANYFGINAWSGDHRYVLALETDLKDRIPDGEPCTLGLVDTLDGNRFIPVTTTRCWNFQEAAMAHWLRDEPDTFVFNDLREGKFCAVVLNWRTKEERIYPFPVSAVSEDGTWALSINYARLYLTRPDYGYAGNGQNARAGVVFPEDDGLWRVNLRTGEAKLLVATAALRDQVPAVSSNGLSYICHTVISKDGRYVYFLSRSVEQSMAGVKKSTGTNWQTTAFTCRADGSEVRRCFPDGWGSSHFNWKPNLSERDARTMVVTCKWQNRFFTHVEFTVGEEASVRRVGGDAMNFDGHSIYSPDGRFVSGDGYWDDDFYRHWKLVRLADMSVRSVGDFYVPEAYRDVFCRCDLHPRWRDDGRQVAFNSVHEGSRQIYLMDVDFPK